MWQEEQKLIHPLCGTAQWEWDENPNAWHADHIYCPGCKRKANHRESILDKPSGDKHAGLEVRLYKLPRED